MYQADAEEERNKGSKPVSSSFYRHTFVTDYNLAFHWPKTRAYCVHSCVNDEETNSLSPDMKEKFREHQKRRKESRAEKDGDKNEPKQMEVFMWRHDMQAVLQTPCSAVTKVNTRENSLYTTYLSFPWLINKVCYSLEWDIGPESVMRGSHLSLAIPSILTAHSEAFHSVFGRLVWTEQKPVRRSSPPCSSDLGQNRNHWPEVSGGRALRDEVRRDAFYKRKSKENSRDFHPKPVNTVIQTARTAAPYVVVPLSHEDNWNFKNVATSRFCNTKTDMKG